MERLIQKRELAVNPIEAPAMEVPCAQFAVRWLVIAMAVVRE
jgi:hypothetical protein